MKLRTKLFSSLGVLTGVLGFAVTAASNTRGPVVIPPGGGGGGVLRICTAPTLAQCQQMDLNAFSLDQCWQPTRSTCASLLSAEAQREYAIAPKGEISVPASASLSTSGTLQPNAAILPYDQRRIGFKWFSDATFEALMSKSRLPGMVGKSTPRYSSLTATLAPRDPAAWEADLGAINPGTQSGATGACAEYAYEKYYDYERFEDAAATCLNDYACIFNVGSMTSTPGIVKPQLLKRDGSPMTVQVRSMPATHRLKNAFYGAPINGLLLGFAQHSELAPSDLSAAATQVSQAMNGYYYDTPDTLGWHLSMHAKQAAESLTASDYASMRDRQAQYASLVATYDGLLATLAAYPDTISKALYGTWTETCRSLSGVVTVHAGPGDTKPPPIPIGNTCTVRYAPWSSFLVPSAAEALQETADQLRAALVAEWNHKNPYTGAIDHGCLDPNSNRCDWEPKTFAQQYLGLYQQQREADYNRCVADTGNDTVVDPSSDSAPTGVELLSTSTFEYYLNRVEALYRKETANLPQATTDDQSSSIPGAIGKSTSGGHEVGDESYFAADYSYGTTWSIKFHEVDPTTGIPVANNGKVCSAEGHVDGWLKSDIWLLGNKKTIVDAAFDITGGQGGNSGGVLNTHMNVFGFDLYTPVNNQAIGGTQPWTITKSDQKDGPHVSSPPIPVILGVPIVISAGANLRYGFDGSANISMPQTCIADIGSSTAPILQAHGSFTPWAAIDASASAAIDAEIASIGLTANLNLITVKLPTNADVSFGFNPDNGNKATVYVNTSTNLELSELSGDVEAFAQFAFWTVNYELFSWDGIHQSIPIFTLNDSYEMPAVNMWLRAHGG